MRLHPTRLRHFVAAAALLTTLSHAAPLKVDLNRAGRPDSEVNEVGYVAWAIPDANSTSRTFDNVTVTLTRVGTVGTGLTTNWYAAGVRPPINAKLVNDGITVRDGNAGGQIELRIRGLSPGPHTLTTYHNTWDNPATNSFGPIDISVNGDLVVNDLVPSNRAATNAEAPVFYWEFEIEEGADLVVRFAAETISSATSRNVVINGFEIDTPEPKRQARHPIPLDADEHVDADTGQLVLAWEAAPTAILHDVYFGTDRAAVAEANRTSPLFVGSQEHTTYEAAGLYSILTYYWRIDEVDALGKTTRGNVWYFRPRQLAFADAEGYGRFARGGRGGRVVHVTTLADYNQAAGEAPIIGSLRYAIERESGPRTIVFDVGGLITLKSRITVNQPYITIAGQTAPGKGICLRGHTLGLSGARDVIVRYLRARPGNISGTTIDGMGMQGSDHSILDHCSISWSIDEAFSSRSARNITLQRTLISEALNAAGHQNYPPGTRHGYAASIGGDVGSFHHNLLAHNYGRNWSLAGGLDGSGFFAGRLDIRNNVVYNWSTRTTDGGAHQVNFVGNFYKPGPATRQFRALIADYDKFPGTQQYYFAGNVMPGHFDETNQDAGRTARGSNGGSIPTTYSPWVDEPFFPSHIDTQSARLAYKRVLSDVGANQPMLDDQDSRVIEETLQGTYRYSGSVTGLPGIPDSQSDVGGWEDYPEVSRPSTWDTDRDGLPDWWEASHHTNRSSEPGDFSDANADPDRDGFTQLDDYLEWMALPRFRTVRNEAVNIDLRPLSRGFTNQPVFTASGATNGTVRVQQNGKWVRFKPSHNFVGLGLFEFTVTDAEGSSMTRTIGVHIEPPAE
jgi:hypothetical protein